VDLATSDGRSTLHRLLDEADVVVHGYRPGALDRFGLGSRGLSAGHPGVVIVHLDAWGHRGPWSARRGFDSIVQAACGIATIEAPDGSSPGALPCQLLDHGTGYLAAAAVLDGLRRQGRQGGTILRSLSLARIAAWLTGPWVQPSDPPGELEGRRDGPEGRSTPPDWTVELDSPAGPIVAVAPPGRLNGRPLEWADPGTGYGRDMATWAQG
jgi:CoA-transferase family III